MPSVREFAVPLRTLDPDDTTDDSDLGLLAEIVGEARVVCLGESAHWVSEFNQLRDRITRFLVRELGFSAFVLESGLPEGLLVDRWVRGGPGQLPEIARDGIGYAFGRCIEMHAQLSWLRNWNTTTHPRQQVGFYGMDVPGWCANPGPGVAACLDRLHAQPGDQALRAATELGTPAVGPAPDASDTPTMPPGLHEALSELVTRAETAGDTLAQQCARGAQTVVEFLAGGLYPEPGRNLRNETMAENLTWILEHEPKVIVAAHNLHLQRSPSFDGTDPIGRLMAPRLGDELVIIGGTHTHGHIPGLDTAAPPERRYPITGDEPPSPSGRTLEAALATTGYPLALVPLHAAGAMQALSGASAIRAQTQTQSLLVDLDPPTAFDAVIHIQHITPVHGVTDE